MLLFMWKTEGLIQKTLFVMDLTRSLPTGEEILMYNVDHHVIHSLTGNHPYMDQSEYLRAEVRLRQDFQDVDDSIPMFRVVLA